MNPATNLFIGLLVLMTAIALLTARLGTLRFVALWICLVLLGVGAFREGVKVGKEKPAVKAVYKKVMT